MSTTGNLRQHDLETVARVFAQLTATIDQLPHLRPLRDSFRNAVARLAEAAAEDRVTLCGHLRPGRNPWCHVAKPEQMRCKACFDLERDIRGVCPICAVPLQMQNADNFVAFHAPVFDGVFVAPVCNACHAAQGGVR